MIAVTGHSTTIVQSLRQMVDEHVVRMNMKLEQLGCDIHIPHGADRFVLAAGVLPQASIIEHSARELRDCVAVNMVNTVRVIEALLMVHDRARIVVIGSESGFNGSYNQLYAMSKAAVHAYVQWCRVLPTQSLVCVSPPVIRDSGMTQRRRVPVANGTRTVSAREVAERVRWALYDPSTLGRTCVERM